MFPAECQGGRNIVMLLASRLTSVDKMEGGRLSRKVSIKTDERSKTPQKYKSAMLIECEADMTASADEITCGASTQQIIIILEHNNHGYALLPTVRGKPMVQRILKTLTTTKQDCTLYVQQLKMIQHRKREKQFVFFNVRNAPIINSQHFTEHTETARMMSEE